LGWAVTSDVRLDLLIRLFYLDEAVKIQDVENLIPKEILRDLLASGLLEREGSRFRPACMLTHLVLVMRVASKDSRNV